MTTLVRPSNGQTIDASHVDQLVDLFKGGLIYSAKDHFGCVGDGNTDDTGALTSAAGAGGLVVFAPGTYLCTASGTAQVFNNALVNGTVWLGAGRTSSVIKLANSSNSRMFTQTTAISGVRFEHFGFDFNGANQTDGAARDDRSGLFFLSVSDLSFIACGFSNGRHGAMLRLSLCDRLKIQGCRASNMGLTATFSCDFAFVRNLTHFRAWGNTVLGSATNPDTGFAQDGVDHSAVFGNVIEAMANGVTVSASATEGASTTAASSFNAVTGNVIKGPTAVNGNGVKVSTFGNGATNMKDVAIAGNVTENCDRDYWIEQVDRCLLANNVMGAMAGTNKQHVLLSSTGTLNDFAARSNKMHTTSNRGFSFSGGSFGGRIVLEDNEFVGVTTAIGGTIPAGSIIRRNPGYNPQGVVAITVTASPFTYTAGPTPEYVTIDGGTVTTVAKNAITLYSFGGAAARCGVWLEPAETVTVTYTVAPTMNADRK